MHIFANLITYSNSNEQYTTRLPMMHKLAIGCIRCGSYACTTVIFLFYRILPLYNCMETFNCYPKLITADKLYI